MIIETIFSTLDSTGQANFAPMGISLGEDEIIVRPFRNTQTCRNLLDTGCGVANFTDDVQAFVKSALSDVELPHFKAHSIAGVVLQDACSWRELEIIGENGALDRPEIRCREIYRGWQRDFLGFCRARNAVIEATILATRIHLYSPHDVLRDLERYEQIIKKTGDEKEQSAFQQVCDYIGKRMSDV
jgi:uncharacterized protein